MASLIREHYYLIFWPEECSYSEVGQAKTVEPKETSVGATVRVKEGTKVHTGKVVGSGSKSEVEKLMMEFEAHGGGDEEQEVAVGKEQGMIDNYSLSCTYCSCCGIQYPSPHVPIVYPAFIYYAVGI